MIIGYIVGVFDKLHYGHKNMIKEGLLRCDRLIIGIHTDEFAKSYKRLPSQNENIRKKEMIIFLKNLPDLSYPIDETHIQLIDDNHILLVNQFKITKIFHGDDWDMESYKKQIKYYELGMEKLGVDIELIPYSRGISTTLILNSNIKTRLINKKCFVFDLDNTLVINNKPKKFAYDLVSKLNHEQRDIYIVTNNNRYTPYSIHSMLTKYQIDISLDNIISTLTVISEYLKHNKYTNIYVWGSKDASQYFIDQDFILNQDSTIVVVLYNNNFNYQDLIKLTTLVNKLPYIIGNIDRIYPNKNILLPDTGCLWKYLEYCCQKQPLFIFGKPNTIMFEKITKKYHKDDIIFIGDSLETDAELASKSNIDFIRVHEVDGDISHLGVLCDYF